MLCEFYARSHFSLLDGVCSPQDLVQDAAEKGYKALGLCDRAGLYGAIPFYQQCLQSGIQPVLGSTLSVGEKNDQIVLLARNQNGYSRLCEIITRARSRSPKGEAFWIPSDLPADTCDIVLLLGTPESCLRLNLDANHLQAARAYVESFFDYFSPKNIYLLAWHRQEEGDSTRIRKTLDLAEALGIGALASQVPQYTTREEGRTLDVLYGIRARQPLSEMGSQLPVNHQRYLKPMKEARELFSPWPELLHAQQRLLECMDFQLDTSDWRIPEFPLAKHETSAQMLKNLCEKARHRIYGPKHRASYQRMRQELQLIQKKNLCGYFLVVWDLMRYAREKGVRGQGRGSGANSIVAYLLGITPVDPLAYNLLFGRFLHEGSTATPDIDLDFASTPNTHRPDREDIIQYVYQKYGREHVAMACTFTTFKARMAIREAGAVLGVSEEIIGRMARLSGSYSVEHALESLKEIPEIRPIVERPSFEPFLHSVQALQGIPRHVSIHVGGMVVTSKPISSIVPVEPAAMANRTVVQWDKDMLEDAGLIKMDILGLRMLSVIEESEQMLRRQGHEICLNSLERNDTAVYERICAADTLGTFQVESSAQMQTLPRTRPRNFEDLAAQVAIVRPGPMQGNMMNPYIARRQGREEIEMMHPCLETVLKETFGVILYQEQVLQVAMLAAGFSESQADRLRRAMSKKRSRREMQKLADEFHIGAEQKGLSSEVRTRILNTLQGFASYGFCKSHALCFAHLTYISCWLKTYHPAIFTAALLNAQPMGFYSPQSLIRDAKAHGVQVRGVCLEKSGWFCEASSKNSIQLGLILQKNLSREQAEKIVQARARKPITSLWDLKNRTGMAGKVVEGLIQSGALDYLKASRRRLLWQLWLLEKRQDEDKGLKKGALPLKPHLAIPALPAQDELSTVAGEIGASGVGRQLHPMQAYRRRYALSGFGRIADFLRLPQGAKARVAGQAMIRQKPPTAKGFAFLMLEDETGMIQLILNPETYQRYRVLFRTATFLKVTGTKQLSHGIHNLLVQTLQMG